MYSPSQMKVVLLFALVGLAACQFFGRQPQFSSFNRFQGSRGFGGQGFRGQGFRGQGFGGQGFGGQGFGGVQPDDVRGRSQYYFSWRHDNGRKYTGGQAHGLCTSLGGGWQPVGISSHDELQYINSIVGSNRLEYIWTGGVRNGPGFRWINGEPFNVVGWSHTGGFGIPQPDNREDGQENCLAVLNNFYQDGIRWHDVGCHHPKAIICERHI
ncbi:ATP-dependent RNA helicase A-like [Procambarus clarkii]|uniref:ATP-dependent RNA helicase A n=1 Tax=Procambarus clarkii TaxID=6728 RepID=UPI001E672AA5|nr:ATP-dependent RNA helicase A-like [Procambarus clarkii]